MTSCSIQKILSNCLICVLTLKGLPQPLSLVTLATLESQTTCVACQ